MVGRSAPAPETVQSTLVDGGETIDPYVGGFLLQAVAAIIGTVAVTAYLAVLDPLVSRSR